jgi:hypothetical protein
MARQARHDAAGRGKAGLGEARQGKAGKRVIGDAAADELYRAFPSSSRRVRVERTPCFVVFVGSRKTRTRF